MDLASHNLLSDCIFYSPWSTSCWSLDDQPDCPLNDQWPASCLLLTMRVAIITNAWVNGVRALFGSVIPDSSHRLPRAKISSQDWESIDYRETARSVILRSLPGNNGLYSAVCQTSQLPLDPNSRWINCTPETISRSLRTRHNDPWSYCVRPLARTECCN